MNKPQVLSGFDLVAKGITKNQATLPELGLKDVFPNGSWLEAKQIQSAIDARKQLIATERIEKSGMLSHAVWREDFMLAEVIQKCGGLWQYMGHNVGKQLFLYPEEALFLIEINSLLLKHNNVKVSLQQAYTLLLRDKKSFIKYKVYSTLSRWGYKVFRHMDTNIIPLNICNLDETYDANIKLERNNLQNISTKDLIDESEKNKESEMQSNVVSDSYDIKNICDEERKPVPVDENLDVEVTHLEEIVLKNPEIRSTMKDGIHKTSPESQNFTDEVDKTIKSTKSKNKNQISSIYLNKIEKHKNRQFKPCNTKNLHIYFENLPNFFNSEIISIKVPENRLIPNNICFSKTIYTLNLKFVRTKHLHPLSPPESQISSSTDDVNRGHIRRVRGSSYRNQIPPFFPYSAISNPRNNIIFQPFNCWPSFVRANYYHFNMSFQRPFLGNLLLTPRFQYFPRFQNFNRPRCSNFGRQFNGNRNQRKRSRDNTKRFHLESLKKLAARLKNLVVSGQTQTEPLDALNNLIQTYNSRYGSKVKLSNNYEIIEDENILDTIELDVDEQNKNKKPRLDSTPDTYTINFNSIKQQAVRLKNLENDNKSSARHRRAFSSLIKTFNKSYNADIYVTSDFDVLDRSFITLESSSDSDCEMDDNFNLNTGGKMVRNPFNILKRLSEKRNKSLDAPGTSSDTFININEGSDKVRDYRDLILKRFSKEWIPDDNDFGRPEIVSGATFNNVRSTDNLIYDFMQFHPINYENWLDLKVSFLSSLEETADFFRKKTELESVPHTPIVSPEDCVDMVSVLKKLSIIKSNDTTGETSLMIDFDVYNRDVQNFRKTNPPTPHFRITCLDESAKFPVGEEITSLHAKYKDNVRIVFAVVGSGTMNFVQISPISLPMHISSNVT